MPGRAARAFLFAPFLFVLSSDATLGQERAAITRVEQDDASVVYGGNWYSNENAAHSDRAAALTNTRGARATITFTGTGIAWIGVADAWAGLANVFLDGAMVVVDTYSENALYGRALHTVRGLRPGPHTLSIEVTHERGPRTDGSWVWIDAFEIENGAPLPGGVSANTGRVEEDHAALVYAGRWYSNLNAGHSGGGAALAVDAGSTVRLSFTGTGVVWIAYRDEWSGVARVYVDGEPKTTIDNYSSPAQRGVAPYSITGLAFGTHTFTIEVTGTRNANAKGGWVWVDGFDVMR